MIETEILKFLCWNIAFDSLKRKGAGKILTGKFVRMETRSKTVDRIYEDD